MSDHATALAQLVDHLVADLPFGPLPVEEYLQADLERLDRSNQFFTLYEGDCDGRHGVSRAEVREPTLMSLESGKNGLVILTVVEGVDEASLFSVFMDLVPSESVPRPGDPMDRVAFYADREWGRLTVAIDRKTRFTRTLMLDTSP